LAQGPQSRDVFYRSYVQTYVQRDVQDLLKVSDPLTFHRFLSVVAARTGQLLNYSSMANEVDIDLKTAKAWLSVLQASGLVYLLQPYHRNLTKRMIKSPKLYFLDTGLACRLMHIRDSNQLRDHHHWGALVETWCVTEILKARYHRGLSPDCWFWRSNDGLEVDLILDQGDRLLPIEIKASATPSPNLSENLRKWRDISKRDETISGLPGLVIYGGAEAISLGEDRFVPWNAIGQQKKIVQ
jgi:predicted AAA+ superfamily ATPase